MLWKQVRKPKLPPVHVGVFDGDASATDALKVFEHAPGCRVCHGHFKHYTLPDGRVIHMFKAPRTIIDQVQVTALLHSLPYP